MMLFDPNQPDLPKRSELPKIPGAPEGAAWFWGKEDQHGRLNLLTPQRILTAKEEIKLGHIVPLDLPLTVPDPPFFGREAFGHKLISLSPVAYDETYSCNPQSGSQWDGFRHHANTDSGLFYNWLNHEEISGEGKSNTRCGVQAWAETGIAGRGVLLDIFAWSKDTINPFTNHHITVSDLLACAKHQNTTFKPGDILIVRTGFINCYLKLSSDERTDLAKKDPVFSGLTQSSDMLDFLHDNYFAAGVADCPSFEAYPPRKGKLPSSEWLHWLRH
ncbi:hypothetical protein B7463_g11173, partial [Scytalidium lignicola]